MLEIYRHLKDARNSLEKADAFRKMSLKWDAIDNELENPQKDALMALENFIAATLPGLKNQEENMIDEKL